jgi:hypothetical protein
MLTRGSMMHRRSVVWGLVCVTVVTGCLFTAPSAIPSVLLGSWGGSDGSLVADSAQVDIDFGCTTVVLPGPVVFDANHAFDVRGAVTSEPGPVRISPPLPAAEVLGSAAVDGVATILSLTFWTLDSTGARSGAPAVMSVQAGVTGPRFACPLEASRKPTSR